MRGSTEYQHGPAAVRSRGIPGEGPVEHSGGFTLTEVQPLDMFPHTQHIECVTTLDRVLEPSVPPDQPTD